MFYISERYTTPPGSFITPLQRESYLCLERLGIPYERVDTDEAITMEDCVLINEALQMKMVKTLFLCDRQKTSFYLFVTTGDKPFSAADFSKATGVSRLSFAPAELFEEMLGVKVGAATIFSAITDAERKLKIVIDKAVANEEYYGCSDGTTTCYMKMKTTDVINKLLPELKHRPKIINV